MGNDRLSLGICQNRQGYDFEENIFNAGNMADQAATSGAEVVVFPEMFTTPYEPAAIRSAARFTDTALAMMKEKAIMHKTYIVAGSVPCSGGDGRLFNRSCVFGPDGKMIYTHDKIHLFDCTPPGGPAVKESATICPGDAFGHFPTPWGNMSVIICYDIRFSPLIQLLADLDISCLFIPAAFSQATGRAHWELLIRMRAVEMQSFVVGVQPACNPDLKYVPWGHSLVVSPWGEILLDAGSGETVHVITLDLSEREKIRAQFPLLAHRRKDLYTTVWRGKA